MTGAPIAAAASICAGSGGDKQRDADAGRGELPTAARSASRCPTASSPPSVVRSCRRSGTMQAACGRLAGDVHHLAGRRHFQIERLGDARLQPRDIVVDDMAAILAQMRGDAVGAGRDRDLGGLSGSGCRPPRALRTVAT